MPKTIVPAIRVPEGGLGPAMLALPPHKRAYVVARVIYGLNRARAAEASGYSTPTPQVAKVQGYRLEHDENIQAAIAEESRKLMRAEGPRSIRTLIEIRDDRKNEAKDRLKAATELLNRAGLAAVSEHHLSVDHHHHLTEAQQDAKILTLARDAGLSDTEARKLLIDPSKAPIDAEFEEVPPEPKTPEQIERAERYRLNAENERQRELAAMTPEEREASKVAVREQRRAEARARYAAAQAQQRDIEDFIAGNGDTITDDGSEGLEDLIGESE